MTASKAVANVSFFVVAGVLFILVSSSRLPHVLATWFPPWGPPGHWMAREQFVAMQVIMLVVVPGLVVLGTLVAGVSAWNNGLVARLQALVTQLGAVR